MQIRQGNSTKFLFWTGFVTVAQAGLEVIGILLTQSSEWWNYKPKLPHLVQSCFFILILFLRRFSPCSLASLKLATKTRIPLNSLKSRGASACPVRELKECTTIRTYVHFHIFIFEIKLHDFFHTLSLSMYPRLLSFKCKASFFP